MKEFINGIIIGSISGMGISVSMYLYNYYKLNLLPKSGTGFSFLINVLSNIEHYENNMNTSQYMFACFAIVLGITMIIKLIFSKKEMKVEA